MGKFITCQVCQWPIDHCSCKLPRVSGAKAVAENRVASQLVRSGSLVSWLAENVAFISWNKHWKGVYLHCVHPKYCVRLFAWGVDWHLKAKHALRKPANTAMSQPGGQS